MTLIFAVSGGGHFLIGSDILLTSDRGDNNPPNLPTFAAKETPIFISGLCTKSVRLTPGNVLLWSGSPLVARVLAAHIQGLLQNNTYEGLEAAKIDSRLNEDELRSVDIIHAILTESGIIHEIHGNVYLNQNEGISTYSGGTGDYSFFHSHKIMTNDIGRSGDHFIDGLSRLSAPILAHAARTIFFEGSNQRNLDFRFGGWFDVQIFTPRGPLPIPYLVKVWSWDGKEMIERYPVIWSEYIENKLNIFHILGSNAEIFHSTIPDILDRSPNTLPISDRFYKPMTQMHLVHDLRDDSISTSMQYGSSDAAVISIQNNRAIHWSNDNFRSYLRDSMLSGGLGATSEPYKAKWKFRDGKFETYTGD